MPDAQNRRFPRPDKRRLEAYRLFITAHAEVIVHIEKEMAHEDVIPLLWYDVLIELYESPGGQMRLHELARNVVLNRSTLTRTLDKLERNDLLRRTPDPADRRGAYAVLTDEGRRALKRAWPVYAKGIVDYFGRHLSDGEAEMLAEIFHRIRSAVRSSSAP